MGGSQGKSRIYLGCPKKRVSIRSRKKDGLMNLSWIIGWTISGFLLLQQIKEDHFWRFVVIFAKRSWRKFRVPEHSFGPFPVAGLPRFKSWTYGSINPSKIAWKIRWTSAIVDQVRSFSVLSSETSTSSSWGPPQVEWEMMSNWIMALKPRPFRGGPKVRVVLQIV